MWSWLHADEYPYVFTGHAAPFPIATGQRVGLSITPYTRSFVAQPSLFIRNIGVSLTMAPTLKPPPPTPRADWIKAIRSAAASICNPDDPPWFANLFTAIAAHESAWGMKYPGGCNLIGYAWLPRQGWGFIEALETMSSSMRRFRLFENLEDCFRALHYLATASTIPGYIHAREILEISRSPAGFIAEFGKTYCPADTGWPSSVTSIFASLTQ